MRIRRKPWAIPELNASPIYIGQPAEFRGRWARAFEEPGQPLVVELGCGKGGFASAQALRHPEINYLAIDKISNMLGVANRTIRRDFALRGREPGNVRLTVCDADRIGEVLGEDDRVQRLYINFCNPWPRTKHKKRRLTFPRLLLKYRAFLAPGAQLHFKTDDAGLFEDSLNYLAQAGFSVRYLTRDLAASGYGDNVETEHERMFQGQGIPIKFCIAQMEALPQGCRPPDCRPSGGLQAAPGGGPRQV